MAFSNPRDNLKAFGLSRGQEVADFGAGPGHYALAASEIVGKDGHVIAVEIQKKLVEKVRTEIADAGRENVSVLWGDIENEGGSTLSDEAVDVVLLSNVLFQVKDVGGTLREATRVLKPGGQIFVVDWSDSFGGLGPPEDHLLAPERLAEAAAQCGLRVGKRVEVGAHHWGVKLLS